MTIFEQNKLAFNIIIYEKCELSLQQIINILQDELVINLTIMIMIESFLGSFLAGVLLLFIEKKIMRLRK